MRGETDFRVRDASVLVISILSPLAGRDQHFAPAHVIHPISILSPLAGRDWIPRAKVELDNISILSPLAGRDSSNSSMVQPYSSISILSPLAGRDQTWCRHQHVLSDFNPLAPCGARHVHPLQLSYLLIFQSSRPLRGETANQVDGQVTVFISILSPLAGRDF